MRRKLIKLLKNLEKEDAFKNEYSEYSESYNCTYLVTEFIDFPNYKTVIDRFNKAYPIVRDSGLTSFVPSNSIRAEINRMEADGLILLGVQKGVRNAHADTNQAPDFDGNMDFDFESIILTTKAKSSWRYLVHKATENPITTSISFLAICISVIALFL